MKTLVKVALAVGTISLLAAIISRLTFTPLNLAPGKLEAGALLAFSNTCFLIAIALVLLEKQTK